MIYALEHIKNKIASTPLSRWFFYLLVFCLPFETHEIWFSSQSFYYGYHAFYNSYYLYLTDFIFFGLMLTWLYETRGKLIQHFDEIYFLITAFWLILAISCLFSQKTALSLYGLARFTEFFLLFAYVREKIKVSREISMIFWLILATFSIQSIVATTQYLTQSSLGLHLLGEETIKPWMPGIAKFISRENMNSIFHIILPYLRPISDKITLVRGYGTLPHPNILSGLLFIGMTVNLYLIYRAKKIVSRENFILIANFVLISIGMIITFSRITWMASAAGITLWIALIFTKVRWPHMRGMKTGIAKDEIREYFPEKLGLIVIILLIVAGLNLFLFATPIHDRLFGVGSSPNILNQKESFTNRELFNSFSVKMIKDHPLSGVGLRNYVVALDGYAGAGDPLLPYLHQPSHNIYLLIAAESGLLALVMFLLIILYIVRRSFTRTTAGGHGGLALHYTLLTIVFGLLALGLFDHYLISSQAGGLILWVMLGLLATSGQNKNDHRSLYEESRVTNQESGLPSRNS